MKETIWKFGRRWVVGMIIVGTVVCGVMGGCRVGGVHESGAFREAGSTVPREFKLVLWNIRKGKDTDVYGDFEGLIRGESPELIFVQEAASDAPEPTGMGAVFAPAWRYPWRDGKAIGVQTMSRVKPVEATPLPTRWREFWVTAPQVSLATTMPMFNGKELLAVNVHCLNFERWRTVRLREQLAGIAATIEGHEGPVILAGDFNTWSEERLGILLEMTRGLGLREVLNIPEGRTTADKGNERTNRLLGVDPRLPLDRVFLRGMDCKEATILAYESSDHWPLLLRLRFRG